MKKIMVSGIQPTNDITLGNYLGAINNFAKLQSDYKTIIFIADLHAITTNQVNNLHQHSISLVKYFLAAGINSNDAIIFKQSDVLHHTFLSYILLCNTTIGELSRMTQFKDKSSKIRNNNGTEFIPTGLLVYPTLMAADILLYDADLVPVGSDQKQHLELTRNIAIRFNNKFKQEIFKIPEPYIPDVGARIMDLLDPTKKMSKSASNPKGVIFLSDDKPTIIKKIKGALTDNFNQVVYDVNNQPGISNLLTIYHLISKRSIASIEHQYKNIENYGVFKNDLANLVADFVVDLQTKYQKITDCEVTSMLEKNANKIIDLADQKIKKIKKVMEF